jgi:hypothetical protein
MRDRGPAGLLLLFSTLTIAACNRNSPELGQPQLTAEFGVYFGGQIQERRDIPFELDGTKQTHGFRVRFAEAPAETHEITWQLSPPRFLKPRVTQGKPPEAAASATPSAGPPPGSELSGSAVLQPGQRELSRAWTFKPGDPLGVWNVRITVDRRVLVDRPFLVYDAHARAKLNRGVDAGR